MDDIPKEAGSAAAPGPAAPFGVNYIGYTSAALGLGVSARSGVKALVDSGIPVTLVEVNLGERSWHDLRFQHLYLRHPTTELPHRCNIVHMNPLEAAPLRAQHPGWFAHSFNVIAPAWELDQPPADWLPLLDQYGLILARSHFLVSLFAGRCSAPVRYFPTGVAIEAHPDAASVRTRLAIPQDAFVVYSNFDYDSSMSRKNPAGALRAYFAAFENDSRAHLILKVAGGKGRPPGVEPLLSRARAASNVTIVDQRLPYAEVLGLMDAADVYLSLHRGEGLGLGTLEAMSLGKPAVVTGWSGVMDFVDESNAVPVRFVRTPVVDVHPEYRPMRTAVEAMWAEPDVGHAARMLRLLSRDAAWRNRLGERARETAAERNRRFFSGEPFRMLQGAFDMWHRACG
ncbi:MAG: glycosyltransferase family 4 protein [Nevskia sp.]|nr:glycosyltransferase family 4 protein [Nevskia sp.]